MSTPTTTQKLTKKQKKSLAFRDRKPGSKKDSSSKTTNDGFEMEDNALPAMEDQDHADLESSRVEAEPSADKGKQGTKTKGKGKATVRPEEAGQPAPVGTGKEKKRKRDEDDDDGDQDEKLQVDNLVEKPKKKKSKKAKAGADGEVKEGAKGEVKEDSEKQDSKAQRFILFVGNLGYTTTKEAILTHFKPVCDPPPTVRLLTPKPKPGVAVRAKSKGCAFLEFKTKVPLQAALKLHQSMLEGRMINVELTAGGGGKSESRLSKVRERNKGLMSQRQRKVEKEGDKSSIPSQLDRPQRFSGTSGLVQQPVTKRTWSVGDVVEENHRGGQRKQRGNRAPKTQGTGVNAIPVG